MTPPTVETPPAPPAPEAPVAPSAYVTIPAADSKPTAARRRGWPMRIVAHVVALLSSQGVACLTLLALMVITYFGTLAQIDRGLVQAQKDYFDSVICWLDLPLVGIPFAVPFPGGLTLLSLLAVNLIVGGLIRLRWGRRTIGIAIVHLGIVGLLVSGLVKFVASTNGFVQLDPGEQKSVYTSFHEWEIVIGELKGDGTVREHLIADSSIRTPGEHGASGIPFTLRVNRYIENARPRQARTAEAADVVDGFYLEALDRVQRASANTPGVYVDVIPRNEKPRRGLLWGLQHQPWTVRVNDVPWTIDLRRRVHDLPYSVRLDEFRKEEHPGVDTPRHFSSDVTKIVDGQEQKFHIAMNRPMRDGGFMLSQNNWGPQDGRPGPYYSVLEVSSNPADQWPKYMCYVIAFGLVLHFLRKLKTHVGRQRRSVATGVLVAAALLAFGGSVTAQDAPRDRTYPWPAELLDRVARIPVQEGGRVKPLATFAGFQMLGINGKRSFKTAWGEKLTPVAWLLDCWFFPEQASHYRMVTVDDLRALESVGMKIDGRERRDRYSLAELEPGLNDLGLKGRTYSLKPAAERTALETQVMTVARRASQLKYHVTFLDFARRQVDPAKYEEVAAAFPERKSIRFLELVEAFQRVRKSMASSDPHAGVKPNDLFEVMGRTLDGASAVAFFPPADPEDAVYRTPEKAMTGVLRGEVRDDAAKAALAELARFEQLVADRGDAGKLAAGLAALETDLVQRATTRGEFGRVDLEVSFYRMDWFYRALCCFLFAFIACAIGWVRRWRPLYLGAWALVIAGEALLITGIVVRCIIKGRPPITTPYEAILFIIAVGVLVILFIEWTRRHSLSLGFAAVLGSLGLVVAAWHERIEGADTMQPLVAVLDTNFWLATHVTTVTLGYCGGILAALVAHVYIFGKLIGFKREQPAFYKDLSRMIYGILGFGVVFATVGTILGGVWANDSWGRFWGWDPKENGALMLVLGYVVILHARMSGHLKDHGIAVASVLLGIIVMWAFWGVNLYQVGLHSYGFSETKRQATDAYYAVEAVVAAIGMITPWLPHVRRRRVGPA